MQRTIAEPIQAIILAGSTNHIPLYPGFQPGYKALVSMLGRPLISYVLDALRGCPQIGRILVVGPDEVQRYAAGWQNVAGVPERVTLIDNVVAGLEAAQQTGHDSRVLFCNPDQPLLRTEMVEDFLERASSHEEDVVSSWIRGDALGKYAGVGAHKLAKFGDGWFGHGNLFLARTALPSAPEAHARFDALYRARKNIVRFAWALGPELFGRFALAVLTGCMPSLRQTMEIATRRFGIGIGAVLSPYPEIALDIDEPEDFAAAEAGLLGRSAREIEERARQARAAVAHAAKGTLPFSRRGITGRFREGCARVEAATSGCEASPGIGAGRAGEGGKAVRLI